MWKTQDTGPRQLRCIWKEWFRRRQWHPTPVLLPGKPHGWRSLVGCSPWDREESDTTERLHFHVSLSCIAEGNGNPLQCSCLENPRDGGARWAAIYGVAQSRTRLKWLSSSSSSPRLSHLPIHRKALNSLAWDIWFSLTNNNHLMFKPLALCCKLLYNLTSPPHLHLLGAVLSVLLEMLSLRRETLKIPTE